MISISETDLARLLQENVRLSMQVTELQAAGTALVTEMRKLMSHCIEVPIRRVRDVPMPVYQTVGSVGLDLCAAEGAYVPAGGRARLPTGIAIELPTGYAAWVLPRSGLVLIEGLVEIVGTIDSDYRGEISIILHNVSHDGKSVKAGARVAQLVVLPVALVKFVEVATLGETARGVGGFGSTGE